MGDFLKFNAFLAGIAVSAAGVFFVLGSLVRSAHLAPSTERPLIAISAVATLFITYYLWRAIHRRIDRSR